MRPYTSTVEGRPNAGGLVSGRRPGPASVFQVSSERLDVGSPDEEQVELMVLAPDQELAQIEFTGVAGQAAVAGQEPA